MFKTNRKGVELSMNTMVIVVLVLLVLIVVSVLLINGAGNWNKGTDCKNQGGQCNAKGTACSGDYPMSGAWSCDKDTHCCVKSLI